MVTPTFAKSSQIATRVDVREGYKGQEESQSDTGDSQDRDRVPEDDSAELVRYGDRHEIGRGGMGRVYKVLDKDLNRSVAMKVLSAGKFDRDSEFRFLAEAQISGQLEHPALLPIHDIGIDDEGRSFFTMRFVADHETMRKVIERLQDGDPETHRVYTMKRRVQIIQRVCDALSYAHARGVVHRDIKPSNILIGSAGEIYLADWGVACLLGAAPMHLEDGPSEVDEDEGMPARESSANLDAVQTNLVTNPDDEGKLVGTPLYMSPEQLAANGDITPASDVYSLCAVAYEFLSLNHYLGPTPPLAYLAIYESIRDCPHIDAESYLHPVGGRVPRPLSRILRKGLQTDRSLAMQSAEEFEQSLQRWLEGKAPIVCPGTFLQHWLGRTSRAIDRRPVAFPAVFITGLTLLFASVVITAITLASHLG